MTIRTPNPQFNGNRLGVQFTNGVAEVESLTQEQLEAFTAWGYAVDAPESDETEETEHAKPRARGRK
ncbi:MAG: hypothetical protein N2045_13855 [Fimbriimonadales bacterium]|nr:hypothetical protein [Fimbriimonadales bacterium]